MMLTLFPGLEPGGSECDHSLQLAVHIHTWPTREINSEI